MQVLGDNRLVLLSCCCRRGRSDSASNMALMQKVQRMRERGRRETRVNRVYNSTDNWYTGETHGETPQDRSRRNQRHYRQVSEWNAEVVHKVVKRLTDVDRTVRIERGYE